MWENFDEATRRAVFSAVFEANERNQTGVDTELLLLGLIVSEAQAALALLGRLGVDREALQAAVEAAILVSPEPATEANGLTAPSKHVLDLAIEEAVASRAELVGTEHLLTALVREEAGVAARLLRSQGVDIARLRQVTA